MEVREFFCGGNTAARPRLSPPPHTETPSLFFSRGHTRTHVIFQSSIVDEAAVMP